MNDNADRQITEEQLLSIVRKCLDSTRDFLGREPTHAEANAVVEKVGEAVKGYRLIRSRKDRLPGESLH